MIFQKGDKNTLNFLSSGVYHFHIDEIFSELQRKWQKITCSTVSKKKELDHRIVIPISGNLMALIHI